VEIRGGCRAGGSKAGLVETRLATRKKGEVVRCWLVMCGFVGCRVVEEVL
jgi:hypothetical protein